MSSRWEGAAYSSVAQMQHALALADVEAIAWRGDERVLDVGCGDGAVTVQIAARVPGGQVLGVDVSPGQVEFAIREHPAPNLAYAVQDALQLSAPWLADVVTTFNTLHWVHDLESAVAGIARVLAPGGLLVCRIVIRVSDRASLEAVIADVCAKQQWQQWFTGFGFPVEHRTEADWRALVEAAGFLDVMTEVEDRSWDYGSRESFGDWLRGNGGTWTQRLPPAEVEPFLDDILTAYAPVAGQEGLFRFYQLSLRAQLA